jgi:hypothetical protein
MRGRTVLLLAVFLGLTLRVAADTYDTHTLVAVTTRDADDVRTLHDIRADIVGRKGVVYRALLTLEQLEKLTAMGFRIEILRTEMEEDRRRWAENDAASAARLATSYYTASKFDLVSPPAGSLMEHLRDQYNAHPDISRLYNLGATQDGAYDIIAMKVSKNPDVVEAEPKIRIYGNIHGDEKGGCMVASDVLDTLLAGYAAVPQDPAAKKLVDESEIWFIPMGNPYGNAHNQRGNVNGVDLNRNFWGPAGSDAPPAWSQKETQVIRDLTETSTADHAKKRFTVSLSFHEGEVCFNSPWNYTTAAPTDEPIFWSSRTGGTGCPAGQTNCPTLASNGLAEAYRDGVTTPGFWFTNGYDWYGTRGDTNDWSYGAWSALDTTIELNAAKSPPASQIPTYCGQHRQAVLNYMLKAFQGIHGVMTDQASGMPLDGTVTATCTASSSGPAPHAYQAVYTDPVAGDFHRVLQPGTYTVTCKAPGYLDRVIPGVVVTADAKTSCNCPMSTPCASNPTAVDVSPAGPLVLCPGTGQTLAANVTGGTGPFTYQWYDGAAGIPGAEAPTYLADAAGVHAYTCKVTGSGCTGGVSDPTPAQITWQAAPVFGGATSVTTPGGALCSLTVSWNAASSACPGTVTYKVYGSTMTPVSIAPGNLVASGLTGTTYTHPSGLVSGTTYYFVVRAVSGSGVEDANTVERSGVPTGPLVSGDWKAGAETGDPALSANAPWGLSTTYKRTGASSYSTGATYPNSACGGLITPPLVLGAGSVLTYYHVYSTEAGYDGGRVEISTNGGGSWAALTPTPAYPGTLTRTGNACTWPVATACYIGNSSGYPTTWQLATVNLSAYGGQTALLRWNFASDVNTGGSLANPGWYVDDINVTNVQVPGPCSAETPLAFHELAPCRVIDTRETNGPLGGPVLAPGVSVRTFPVTGTCGIPATAKALSVNQTVTQAAVTGFIRVYPGDLTGALIPITTSVSFPAGKTRANNGILALARDGSGTIAVENDAVGGTVHFILDVNGYFE